MIALLLLLTLQLTPVSDNPADSITIGYCYQQAEKNYPAAANVSLKEKIAELNIRIAHTGYYPQVSFNGKASYQSEVTEFGGPGSVAPSVSKDQYEAALQINQKIYDGGATGIQKEMERERGVQEVLKTRAELHKVRAQVDEVYFGILIAEQQQEAAKILIQDLNERLGNVRSKVENGVLLRSQQLILEAELIKARQDSSSIMSNIKAGYSVLEELTGQSIPLTTKLTLPDPALEMNRTEPLRPELALFKSSGKSIQHQKSLIKTNKIPKVWAFGTVAFGRPGLNFLKDDFHDYYLVGVRLSWNLMDFLNAEAEEEILDIRQKTIRHNEEVFNLQLKAQLSRISEQIGAIEGNILRDKNIIELRDQVVAESERQLENGVITATEYVTELNNANRARLSLFTNQIRLIQAQAEYRTALGYNID